MAKKKYIFILIIFFSIKNYAQKKIVVQSKIDNFEISPNTLEKQEEYRRLLETDVNLSGWIYYYRKKGHFYLSRGKNDSVLYYTQKAIERYHQKDTIPGLQERQMKDIYLFGAIVLTNTKKYRQSTDFLFKAIEISKKYPNAHQATNPYLYSYLASNYLKMGDKQKALHYNLKTTKDSVFMSKPSEAAPRYNHLGELHKGFGNNDSALYYYRKSIENRLKYDHYGGIRVAYNNIGDVYRRLGNLDSTLYYYTKSKEILDEHPENKLIESKYFTLSNYNYVLLKNRKIKESIKGLRIVLDSTAHIEKIDDNVKALRTQTMDYLVEAYSENNELHKALEISLQKSKLLEKFHQQVLDERLRELNIAYEVKEKDESIEQLEAVTEEQKTIINQRNIIALILLVFLLLIIGITILIFRQRKLKNKYETTNLEQRLLRSQLNPHFIFNALNTVSNLVRKNSENTLIYIAKLSSLIRLILKNSREEFISLQDEVQSVEDYLELQSNFSQKFEYRIQVADTIDREEVFIPPMLIQPFIENAIEHGLRGVTSGLIEVDIRVTDQNQLIQCKITDNGVGLSKASSIKSKHKNESFSGKIIKERLQIYAKSLNKKASYTIREVTEGIGTEVSVLLPYVIEG